MTVGRAVRAAWLLLLITVVLALEPAATTSTRQALTVPSAFAYIGNFRGQDVPVYRRPRADELPIGYFPPGTRVEILSNMVRGGRYRWLRVRAPNDFEAWAPTRALRPGRPFEDAERRDNYPTYAAGPKVVDPLELCLNPSQLPAGITEPEFNRAVAQALELWQDAANGAIPIERAGFCDADVENHGDGVSVIGWGQPEAEDGTRLLGLTHTRASGNKVVEADVILSSLLMRRRVSSPMWMLDRDQEACLSQTLAHEIGHVIGLAHAAEEIGSVMRPGALCVRVSRLPRADVQNVRALY